jgi:hypothetical protein
MRFCMLAAVAAAVKKPKPAREGVRFKEDYSFSKRARTETEEAERKNGGRPSVVEEPVRVWWLTLRVEEERNRNDEQVDAGIDDRVIDRKEGEHRVAEEEAKRASCKSRRVSPGDAIPQAATETTH